MASFAASGPSHPKLGAKTEAGPSPRFGLALSGGGFRAALFHLGVLARLAELDVLRQVELISTVSGGSIIGAAYYLQVKKLLESKRDLDISRLDFVDLIENLERFFLAGVQRNIRVRAFANPWANLRVAAQLAYSRSDRLGHLYDRIFYAPLFFGGQARAGECIAMSDLLIRPAGLAKGQTFSPLEQNPTRRAKVPMLFLNATSLNTGRHWIFTPTWMGEHFDSRLAAEERADLNAILKGLPYAEAALPRHQRFPLGTAVAASAGVPGLFPPLPIENLYPGWLVELVDGGVHDNQGTAALDQYGCQSILVSDGSELMRDELAPLPFLLEAAIRSGALLLDRIRDLTVGEVLSRADERPEVVLHLRDGLLRPEVDPQLREHPVRATRSPNAKQGLTRAGINPDLQLLLSRIRTDLDAFSDIEADTLMAFGYLLAKFHLSPGSRLCRFLQAHPEEVPSPECPFRFRWALSELQTERPRAKIARHLAAGEDLFFKVFSVFVPKLLWKSVGLLALAAGAVLYGVRHWSETFPIAPLHPARIILAGLGVLFCIGLLSLLRPARARIQKAILGVLTLFFIGAIALVDLLVFNPIFLRAGKRPSGR